MICTFEEIIELLEQEGMNVPAAFIQGILSERMRNVERKDGMEKAHKDSGKRK